MSGKAKRPDKLSNVSSKAIVIAFFFIKFYPWDILMEIAVFLALIMGPYRLRLNQKEENTLNVHVFISWHNFIFLMCFLEMNWNALLA